MEMSFKSNFLFFKRALYLAFFLIIVGFFLDFFEVGFYKISLIILFAIFVLPSVVIQVFYFLEDYGKKIFFDSDSLKISSNGVDEYYDYCQIDSVCIFKTRNEIQVGVKRLPSDFYYYVKVFMKDGRVLVVTCLIDEKLESKIKQVVKVSLKESVGNFYF